MKDNRLQQLADELDAALADFRKLSTIVADAQRRLTEGKPAIFDLYALAGILHDLYRGVEGICNLIVKQVDQREVVGPSWHRELLDLAARPIPNLRPEIIATQTATQLEDYRAFRHRMRNIYGFELDWPKMKPLFDNALLTIDIFSADIERFIAFLRLFTVPPND